MTQDEKNLLLKELCARIPYGVKVNAPFTSNKKENAKIPVIIPITSRLT